MEDSGDCVICKKPLGICHNETEWVESEDVIQILGESPSSTLTEKGCAGIKKASEVRKNDIKPLPGQKVHQDCRRKYCNPQQIARNIKQGTTDEAAASFFCGQPAMVGNKRKCFDVVSVRTVELKDTIWQCVWKEVMHGHIVYKQEF